ncbi:proteasome maturation factor UMP1 [Auriscalpium vulgare]|uniref:Proteasome maturation factor UMP1 n=1 Tax=Auriscalpium vulgare TaxID=40419 RepID=A0ACB8RL13_9AGAM|nr:proteasome maturation factor UMP1 [Auriscalpium vulgare]
MAESSYASTRVPHPLLRNTMESSMRIVPASAPKLATVADTAGSLGLHDTLKYGPRSLATEIKTTNSLQNRLENWDETQDSLKLTIERNIYGLHAPMRQLMERKIISVNRHMPAFPQSNVHLDILMGRDETLDVTDFFGNVPAGPSMDIHADMEKKLRMQ